MEDTLRELCVFVVVWLINVLILVLMEDTLRERVNSLTENAKEY